MGYHSYQPGILGAFIITDAVVQVLAILGNSLVLLAVVNVKIGLVGFRRFLISLLANNIFLCVSQVFIAIYLEFDTTVDRQHSCVGTFLDSVKLFAVFAALFNLCGMSLDHLIGIVNPIKYDFLMNARMAVIAPFLIWIFAFVFAFLDIPIAALVYYMYSYRPVASGASYLALFEVLMNSSTPPMTEDMATVQKPSVFGVTTPTLIPAMPVAPPERTFFNRSILRTAQTPVSTETTTFQQGELFDAFAELNSLRDIDVELLQEETDWCLISHSYKLYWVQWFRLICTCVAFVFLLICYGRIFGEIRKKGAMMTARNVLAESYQRQFQNCNNCASNGSVLSATHNNSRCTNGSGKLGSTSAPILLPMRRQPSLMQRRSSRKFVMTTLSLLSVFGICWLPFIMLEISVSPELLMTSTPQPTVTRLHLLQHVFNSLFLSYPLLDAIICVSRMISVRKYIISIVTFPFKWRKMSNFSNVTVSGQDSSTLIITYPKSQTTGSSLSLNNGSTTAARTSNNDNTKPMSVLEPLLSIDRTVSAAEANGFIFVAGALLEPAEMSNEMVEHKPSSSDK